MNAVRCRALIECDSARFVKLRNATGLAVLDGQCTSLAVCTPNDSETISTRQLLTMN